MVIHACNSINQEAETGFHESEVRKLNRIPLNPRLTWPPDKSALQSEILSWEKGGGGDREKAQYLLVCI